MQDRNAVLSKLRQRGWRITPQRLAIIEFLEGNTNHPSALEIFQALKPLYPSLSPTTVYSTLHVLKELGEVVEICGGTEGSRYDPNVHPHANLICLHCQRIIDLDLSEDIDTLAQSLATRSGFEIKGTTLLCYGLCPACRATQQEEEDHA